ncbi:reverse transcriptase (RNA-dependent DNA polymerase) domain-containing protein [Phthorimaea operculella]|nr:reverse transcriptase (RNA-dependent DNA polymerase) domain-containing protein [Phthorimaea operculella]
MTSHPVHQVGAATSSQGLGAPWAHWRLLMDNVDLSSDSESSDSDSASTSSNGSIVKPAMSESAPRDNVPAAGESAPVPPVPPPAGIPPPLEPEVIITGRKRKAEDAKQKRKKRRREMEQAICILAEQKFRLINMHKIPNFLQPRDWLVKIDLSNAYFHLAVAKSHRCFLRLVYKKRLYQMTCLPFGLACAPKVFASLTNWIGQVLRDKGFRIAVYLDDFLLANQDPVLLISQAQEAIKTLQYLGWQVNFAKSDLVPSMAIQYLGIMWNPHTNEKYLPTSKILEIQRKITSLLKVRKANLREIQSVVGMLNFASFPVPRGRLNHRALLRHCQNLLKLNPSHRYPIPNSAQQELNWWVSNLEKSSPIHYPPVSNYLVTDASEKAWGAQLNNLKLAGQWSQEESQFHSNMRGMLAIWYVLKDYASLLEKSSLMIQCDNRTVVAYMRNEGGMKSAPLMDLTYHIFSILDKFQIHVVIHYLPGRYNCEADRLSRLTKSPEWHLLPKATNLIFAKMGQPTIDLFASALAHVLPIYVTMDLTDRQAYLYDAFSHQWNYPIAWVFPPPCLIPRVLQHLNTAKGIYLIVVPRWLKVFWRPDLKNRALGPPFTIHNLDQVLVDATTGLPPSMIKEMTLEVWRCGGGLNL